MASVPWPPPTRQEELGKRVEELECFAGQVLRLAQQVPDGLAWDERLAIIARWAAKVLITSDKVVDGVGADLAKGGDGI